MNENKVVKGDFKQEIFNTVNENVRALETLFPSVVKDGQVDFEALKEELGQFEEVGAEKYGLTWAGKQNAKKIAQEDIIGKTLKFVPEDSKDTETTENLYIEGDNLEVLKLLRQNYYGAIKMIYIDPPYNTGNDFVYNDKFSMKDKESDSAEGQSNIDGERFIINQKSGNKYHANWLNMIYPRIKLSKDLLMNNGVIFISIDDNEVDNIKKVCNEIFGEENFVNQIIWTRNSSGKTVTKQLTVNIEYLLVYSKTPIYKFTSVYKPLSEATINSYSKDDNDGRGKYCTVSFQKTSSPGPETTYDYIDNNGKVWKCPTKGWRMIKSKIKALENDGRVYLEGDTLREKCYWNERTSVGKLADTFWNDMPENNVGTKEVAKLFDGKQIFSNPKPTEYLMRMLEMQTNSDTKDVVLDFFSGSASLAHAVMKLNQKDKGNRKFIMVQIPQQVDDNSLAKEYGYNNICEIGVNRIKRAGEKICEELDCNIKSSQCELIDLGIKIFKVSDTNIRWNYEDIKAQRQNLMQWETQLQIAATKPMGTEQIDIVASMMSDKDKLDFMPGTKDIDVVYELLLRQRDIPLSAKVELLSEIGGRTYLFAQSYLVCLETEITNELIEKITSINPLPIKFIFRDSAFEDDINLKDETIRRFKALVARQTGEQQKAYTVEFI